MALQDKKIRSKIALTFNTGLRTQKTSVVTGKIMAVAYKKGFTHLAVNFAYFDADGQIISNNAWQIETSDEQDALFNQIEPLLPPSVAETQDTLNKFYQGFLAVAADNWGTDVGDWEIVDDVYTVPTVKP